MWRDRGCAGEELDINRYATEGEIADGGLPITDKDEEKGPNGEGDRARLSVQRSDVSGETCTTRGTGVGSGSG